jgi:hypothetical protein
LEISAARLRLAKQTVQNALDRLQSLEIAREMTGKRRDRLYEYTRYMEILDEGTEPLPR